MVDFSSYLPPGVYVEEDASDFVAVLGIQPSVVAIVGPGLQRFPDSATVGEVGSPLVADPSVPYVISETDLSIGDLGIDVNSIQVFASAGGTLYTLTDDYTLNVNEDDEVEIDFVSDGAIIQDDELETVFVTYDFTPFDYFEPHTFVDFDDVQDAYGPPFDSAGTIVSPLSLAARIAFLNGAREIVIVATGSDPTSEAIDVALGSLPIRSFDLVVPLPVDQDDTAIVGVVDVLAAFVNDTDDRLAMGIIGTEAVAESAARAQAAGNSRLITAWPNTLKYFHGPTNSTVEIAGYYLAAAYAGRLSGLEAQNPLTKKQIFGFTGVPISVAQEMTSSTMNALTQAGVAVTELTRDNRLVVRHGVTASAGTNIQHREISLIRARDRLMTSIQETVDGVGIIGTWIDEDTPRRVKGIVGGVLEASVLNDLIVAYDDLKARQLDGDPSVIEVKFRYRPAYPLNYILVSFSINTETGAVTTVNPEEVI